MDFNNINNEIKRLNFEDLLWIIFATLSLINIYGDYFEKEYLKTNNKKYKNNSNSIYIFTLIVTLLIYLYFFKRNYKAYLEVDESKKKLYRIKVLGSALLISGVLCLLYFQENETSFVGSPGL